MIECFAVVFNESAATVLEYEKEVKKLYREVAELKHAVYKRVQVKKSGPSVSSVQNIPAVSESDVPEASSVPTVAGFPLHHNPFRILDHEIHLAGTNAESDSDDEEVIPLLDPRRNRSDHSVSSLGPETGNQCWKFTCRFRNQFSISLWEQRSEMSKPLSKSVEQRQSCAINPENTPPENPQTMSRSEWKPREPPTFSGRLKEDVHQWTAIVSQYFTLVPGTDQQHLTYAVSLLRGTCN